jgi:hypothetical protein
VTVSQKAALSLLISVVVFTGFTVLAYTGLFDLVEAKFYNPSIISSLTKELDKNSYSVETFLTELQSRFSATLDEAAVKRSFLSEQADEDIRERSGLYGRLAESQGGFQWVRFIDAGGMRLHYSTWEPDILRQGDNSVTYRNYTSSTDVIPYEEISSADKEQPRIIADQKSERLLFSFPFYDSYNVFRGTALFSLSIRAVSERLIGEGRIKASENLTVVSSPGGIVIGMPAQAGRALVPEISSIWTEGILTLTKLVSAGPAGVPDMSLALITVKTAQGLYLGHLINESVFSFPQVMKIILLASFFLTVYLVIFLLFNLRQDSFTIVQNRLKQLQISIIGQYYDRKSDMDWGRWTRELEQRRDEIRGELKKGIRAGKDGANDIDQLIDKSWDELLGVIGGRRANVIDEEKLQTILSRVLAAPAVQVPAAPQTTAPRGSVSGSPVPTGEVEEIEALDAEEVPEAEAVEEIAEAEAADVEEVEEIPEAEAVEEIPEAEAADVEEVEEIPEAEAVEEIAEAEAADVEEVEEIPEAGAVEEIAEAEAAKGKAAKPENPAGGQKPTNVKLVFGDDDIPYVVESSGLELVGEDIDQAMKNFGADDNEPADLEDLEELDDVESGIAGESGDLEDRHENDSPGKEPELDLAAYASHIEFSVNTEIEEEEVSLAEDLEVVSPFTSMLSDLEKNKESPVAEEPETNEPAAAEETLVETAEDTEEDGGTAESLEELPEIPAEDIHQENKKKTKS